MTNYLTKKEMKYISQEVWFPLSESILEWDVDFHDLMLNDEIRMNAYEKAIKEVVKPGMVVLDLGVGTGILSLWALQAGASKVYGIDVNQDIIKKANERIQKAGFEDKFTTFNNLSYDTQLPQRVDVIISEILGNLADNEDMTPILDDAKKRFLKKGGVMLPQRIQTSLVPVSSIISHNQIKNKRCSSINNIYDLNDLLKKLKLNNQFDLYYDCILPKETYLSKSEVVQSFNFDGTDKLEYQTNVNYIVKKDDLFTGFKGSFLAQLSEKTDLDISGDNIERRETSDCWKHSYLPIENAIEVKVGDIIELNYSRFYPQEKDCVFRQGYSWSGVVKRDGVIVGKFSQRMT